MLEKAKITHCVPAIRDVSSKAPIAEEEMEVTLLECRNPSVLFPSSVSEVHRSHEMNKRKKFKVSESDGTGGERKFLKYPHSGRNLLYTKMLTVEHCRISFKSICLGGV